MHAAFILLCLVTAVVALPPVSFVAIVPRADGYYAVATISDTVTPTASASLNVRIEQAGLDHPTLEVTTRIPAYTDRLTMHAVELGKLSQPPTELVLYATVSDNYGSLGTQTFRINATGTRALLGLLWVPDGNGNYTLTPTIPSDWGGPHVRWNAVCEGAPHVLLAAWGMRSVRAQYTQRCNVQVSMDAVGYVISDIIQVQGGWVNETSVVIQQQQQQALSQTGWSTKLRSSAMAIFIVVISVYLSF